MKEVLPLSNLDQHMGEAHGLTVAQPTESSTPQGQAKRIEIYTRNKETHERVHGGNQLQRVAGTPEHVHQPFVKKAA